MLCIVQAPTFFNKGNDFVYRFFIFRAVSDKVDDFLFFEPVGVFKRIDQRESHLFFLDVDSKRFANFILSIIKKVVLDLESHPHFFSKIPHALYGFLVSADTRGSHGAARSNEAGGFLADDLVVYFLIYIQFSGFVALQKFAFRHLSHGIGYNP